MPEKRQLEGRIAVVTGASRGIGYAVAVELARAGAHLILLARTVGGLEELDDRIKQEGASATLVPASVSDMPALDRLGAAINERWGKLDILVGNAGVLGPIAPLGHVRGKDWDEVMSVNVTANWRLIRSLDPLLRKSDAGRAVFMTSGAPRSCRPYWGPYSASKAALEALVRTYAAEVANMSVRANLFNPGPVRTAMRARAMPGEDPATLPKPAQLAPSFLDLVSPAQTRNGLLFDWPGKKWIDPATGQTVA